MGKGIKTVLITAASVIGVFVLMLYTTITDSILFKGFSFCTASNLDVALIEAAFFSSAWISGFIVSILVVRKSVVPHLFISLYIFAKFLMVENCQGLSHFHVFEIGSNTLLLAGLWVGHFTALKFPMTPMPSK